jgi:CRISPR type I-E-associated protein CasB/Cse2
MSSDDPFIRYLYSLKQEDTGTLAALRRACGQRLAESRNCQNFASISSRPADFFTATLAAQYSAAQIKAGRHHARYDYRGSIGSAWARFCRERDRDQDPATFYRRRQEALARGQDSARSPAIHERFRTLLDAELEIDGTGELAYRLRGLVRMCAATEVPIDVIQLAHDLRGWRAESRYVQERWARAFYGQPKKIAKDQVAAGNSDMEEVKNEGQTDEDQGEIHAD